MIIIDNIINNAKAFLLTGSFIAILNLLLIFTVIILTVRYIKYYRAENTIIVEHPNILKLFNYPVIRMQVIKTNMIYHMKMTCTETFSHWCIRVVVDDEFHSQLLLTSSKMNNKVGVFLNLILFPTS